MIRVSTIIRAAYIEAKVAGSLRWLYVFHEETETVAVAKQSQ